MHTDLVWPHCAAHASSLHVRPCVCVREREREGIAHYSGRTERRKHGREQVVGLQEDFDLGDGWKLLVREDKKDRFTLIRTGPKMDSDEIAQVPHASFIERASGARSA